MFTEKWYLSLFSLPPWLNTDKPYWNEFLPVAIVLLAITIATTFVISYLDPSRKTFIILKERIENLETEARVLRSELELISKPKNGGETQSK